MISKYQFFKETIKNTIQNSGLDIGIIYYILKDIFREIEALYFTQINREIAEESNNIKEENEESSEK